MNFPMLIVVCACVLAKDPELAKDSKMDPNRSTLIQRVIQTPKGEMSLTVSMSNVIQLKGIEKLLGRFFELHVITNDQSKKNDRVVWREFLEHTFPNPKTRWFGDVIFDQKKENILLCLGTDDSIAFLLCIISMDAGPRLASIPKQPLSLKDSENLLHGDHLKKRNYEIIAPPMPIYTQIPGIQGIRLHQEGSDLQVLITVSENDKKPPLVLHYSLTQKQWSIDKPK